MPQEKGQKGHTDKEYVNFVPHVANVTVPFAFKCM